MVQASNETEAMPEQNTTIPDASTRNNQGISSCNESIGNTTEGTLLSGHTIGKSQSVPEKTHPVGESQVRNYSGRMVAGQQTRSEHSAVGSTDIG